MSRTEVDENFESHLNNTLLTNDKTVSTNEFNLLHYITSLYGNTLSAKGLNLLDPIYTNMFYYNKMRSRPLTDMPYVSRTYAFFTRPECNFSFENINSIPFFKWLYSKPIGKMLMSMLTDPEYYIYTASATNSNTEYAANMRKILSDMANSDTAGGSSWSSVSQEMSSNAGTQTYNSESADIEEQLAQARLDNIDIDSLSDDAALENIMSSQNFSKISNFYKNYDKLINTYYDKMEKEDKNLNIDYTKVGYQAKRIMYKTHNGKYDQFNFTSPFIPLLMNTCTSLTGAKDLNLQVYEYEEDEFSTKQNVATGMDDLWAPGQITASFEDITYGPVSLLFMLWIFYIHYVSRGYITSTREHILERILDYTCSIYVFVIGPDGRTIERFGKFTGCYPTSFPLSQQLEHNNELDPSMLHKIQINFQYNRYEPMNPEILTDFNFVSETEWLFKLKNWDTLYDRNSTLSEEARISFVNRTQTSIADLQKIHAAGRSSLIWDTISDPGMSGKVPRALINGTNIDTSKDLSNSDLMSNIWGGYPVIVNSKELIWVMPTWDDTSAKHDRGTSSSTTEVIDTE